MWILFNLFFKSCYLPNDNDINKQPYLVKKQKYVDHYWSKYTTSLTKDARESIETLTNDTLKRRGRTVCSIY